MNTTAVIVLPEWIVWMAAALIALCMFNEIAALYLSWLQRKLKRNSK
jgi:hypothetical protein